MRIQDFPRPPDDNGRGIHWSAILYHNDVTPNLDHWIDELVAMKIKWVKLLDDGGGSGLQFSRQLMQAGIMPVIRFYFPQLNPHHMGPREMETVSRYVEFGARYFESNNEPDLVAEWRNNHRPANWLDIVVDNFIRDADGVLPRGGLLAMPAMGPGSLDNPFAMVVQKGRQDLFENGCWAAIHNYTLNHPLDYPSDPVNQEGQPLTQEEYDVLAQWEYSHLSYDQIVAQGIPVSPDDYGKFNRWAWDGRPMALVNETRQRNKNPGDTILDDANCFRAYESWGQLIHDALGFHVPIISTEGGAVVGWGDDNRYAKVNPTTQQAMMLEITRLMQSRAPVWYFSCCTWLLASRPLGDHNPTWGQMSWYTNAWDLQFGLSGQLPIVQALKDEPSRVRPELQSGTGVIHGVVQRSDGQPLEAIALRLVTGNRELDTVTAADGNYRFESLGAGDYQLLSGSATLLDGIELADGQTLEANVTIADGQQSRISGTVSDTSGQARSGVTVTLNSAGDETARMRSAADGSYQFENLAAGSYLINAGSGAAAVAGIVLDGFDSRTVDLTVPAASGERYIVETRRLLSKAETGNQRMFYGLVLDEAGQGLNGITVQMSWPDAQPNADFPRVVTPKDHFKPAGNFEFLHGPGEFMLQVLDPARPSDMAEELLTTGIPGREGDPITWEVNFQRVASGDSEGTGSLGGVITGGAGLGLTLWLGEGTGQAGQRSWATLLPDDGSYEFEALPGGHFTLELEGQGELHQLDLDDGESATFNHQLGTPPPPPPPPVTGALDGTLRTTAGDPVAGRQIMLLRDGVQAAMDTSDDAGRFHFSGLEPGIYAIAVDGAGTLADSVSVAGGVTGHIELILPEEPAADKLIAHYLLLPANEAGRDLLDLLMPHLRAVGLTTGVRLAEAAQASEVLIVGGEDVVSAANEQMLRDRGSVVQRLPADPFELAEALQL